MPRTFLRLAMISTCALGACDEEGPIGLDGPAVAIAVAPLVLPNVVDTCFKVSVHNGTPTTAANQVWVNNTVCSTQYGNDGGGDVTYIGPCDADTPSAIDNLNYINLTLDTIEVGAGQGSYPVATKTFLDDQTTAFLGAVPYTNDTDPDFVNPCPATNPCQLAFECQENEDVLVEFNLTVMGDANQGFFDIAVNFEDVYCSSKYDSCYDNEVPIELLFGDDTDTLADAPPADLLGDEAGRDRTGVFAMACTAGPGAGITTDILLSTVQVTCPGAVPFALPISGLTPAAGNHTVSADLDGGGPLPTSVVQYATYFGKEDLACGSALTHAQNAVGYLYGQAGEYVARRDVNTWNLFAIGDTGFTAVLATAQSSTPPARFTIGGAGAQVIVLPYQQTAPVSCNKSYLNIALNLEDLPLGCTLSLQAAAQDASATPPTFTGGVVTTMTTSGTSYPFISVSGANLSHNVCVQDPLNETGGSVSTFYASSMIGGTPASIMCDHSAAGAAPASLAGTVIVKDPHATRGEARASTTLAGFGKWDRYLGIIANPCGGTSTVRDLVNWDTLTFTDNVRPATTDKRVLVTKTGDFGAIPMDAIKVRAALLTGTTPTYIIGNATTYVTWGAIAAAYNVEKLGQFRAGDQLILELITDGAAVPGGYPANGVDVRLAFAFAGDPPLRVFVTAQTSGAELGGVAGADARCASLAQGLGGQWRAWISVGNNNPSTRFGATVGTSRAFALLDGNLIANNWSDLTDGSLQRQINLTQTGSTWGDVRVWTNTNPDGTTAVDPTPCEGFTNSASGTSGPIVGRTGASNTRWSVSSDWNPECYASLPLYCFEQAQ